MNEMRTTDNVNNILSGHREENNPMWYNVSDRVPRQTTGDNSLGKGVLADGGEVVKSGVPSPERKEIIKVFCMIFCSTKRKRIGVFYM